MSPSIPHQLNSLSSHFPSPPVFNFLTFFMCGIGYNEFPHFFHAPFQAGNIPHIFPMFGILAIIVFLTSIPHMLKILHIFLTLKFIAKNDLLYFLAFSDVRKEFLTFPQPVVNFLTFCMCGTGSNEFPHILPRTRPSWKIKRKIPYTFPMYGISANALFLTSIPHIRKNSSLFPHIKISWCSHGCDRRNRLVL